MENIDIILADLKAQYDNNYGFSIFFVEAESAEDQIILTGRVLLESQKQEAANKVKTVFNGSINNQIVVLSDLESRREIGWGGIKNSPVNVYQYPPFCKTKSEALSTQVYDIKEYFRLLYQDSGFYLVQLIDFTLGWVKKEDAILSQEDRITSFDVLRPLKDNLIILSKDLKDTLSSMAMEYLDVKYVWGGITKNGIDCSGLTQRLYREVFNIILPRNSKDQRRSGLRVNLSDIQFADLLFLRSKKEKLSHVGIFLHDYLIHASLKERKVIRQTLDDVFKNYDFVGVRRYIQFV